MEKGALLHRRSRVAGVLLGAEGENFGEADMKAVRIGLVNLPEKGALGIGRDRHASIPVFTAVKQQLFLLERFLKRTAGLFPLFNGRKLPCSRRTKRGGERLSV
jgi:hypothetical protein